MRGRWSLSITHAIGLAEISAPEVIATPPNAHCLGAYWGISRGYMLPHFSQLLRVAGYPNTTQTVGWLINYCHALGVTSRRDLCLFIQGLIQKWKVISSILWRARLSMIRAGKIKVLFQVYCSKRNPEPTQDITQSKQAAVVCVNFLSMQGAGQQFQEDLWSWHAKIWICEENLTWFDFGLSIWMTWTWFG